MITGIGFLTVSENGEIWKGVDCHKIEYYSAKKGNKLLLQEKQLSFKNMMLNERALIQRSTYILYDSTHEAAEHAELICAATKAAQ